MHKNDGHCDLFTRQGLNYSDAEIEGFVEAIRREGIVEIPQAFNGWVIEESKKYILEKSNDISSDYFSLRGSEMKTCVLTELQNSDTFRNFLNRILLQLSLNIPNDTKIHHVARSIHGDTNSEASNKYHFDAYNLTVAMPILIPADDKKKCGDFIYFGRRRSAAEGLVSNIFYKLVFQHRWFQRLATTRFFHKYFDGRRIKFRPLNMYIFEGFRTYHGNDLIDPSLHRITGLYHYGDPFEGSALVKWRENNRKRPQSKN